MIINKNKNMYFAPPLKPTPSIGDRVKANLNFLKENEYWHYVYANGKLHLDSVGELNSITPNSKQIVAVVYFKNGLNQSVAINFELKYLTLVERKISTLDNNNNTNLDENNTSIYKLNDKVRIKPQLFEYGKCHSNWPDHLKYLGLTPNHIGQIIIIIYPIDDIT